MRAFLREILAASGAATLGVGTALAGPMDLADSRPRWVQVQIEDSPANRPGQLASSWTRSVPAWLQPASHPGWVVVSVPGEAVERYVLPEQEPKPGSFGDFVWLFDTRTGHVLATELEGTVFRRVGRGPLRIQVEAEIRVEMSTEGPLGFRPERQLLGQKVYEACALGAEKCTAVAPAPYDPATGYVNAVGTIRARGFGVEALSFSTLGEARFFELDELPVVATSGDE